MKINGKTSEDIKKGIWRCLQPAGSTCVGCPYNGTCLRHPPEVDALDLIKHLEDERDAALAKVPRWISVEERLPELPDKDYCYVIVNTFLKGNANSAPMEYERTIIRGKREERWRWISGNLAYTPDFWMPLPEPPKEDTHG